jgi:hypothetical protein
MSYKRTIADVGPPRGAIQSAFCADLANLWSFIGPPLGLVVPANPASAAADGARNRSCCPSSVLRHAASGRFGPERTSSPTFPISALGQKRTTSCRTKSFCIPVGRLTPTCQRLRRRRAALACFLRRPSAAVRHLVRRRQGPAASAQARPSRPRSASRCPR